MPGGLHIDAKRWEAAEDRALVDAIRAHGKKWGSIEHLFPGRNRQQIRCRWSRIQSGVDVAKAGKARNKCRKCGQIKRGHVCTWGLPPGANNAVATGNGTDDSEVSTYASNDHGEQESRVEVKLVPSSPSVSSTCSSSPPVAPMRNHTLRLSDKGTSQRAMSAPRSESQELLLTFIRTSKRVRG